MVNEELVVESSLQREKYDPESDEHLDYMVPITSLVRLTGNLIPNNLGSSIDDAYEGEWPDAEVISVTDQDGESWLEDLSISEKEEIESFALEEFCN